MRRRKGVGLCVLTRCGRQQKHRGQLEAARRWPWKQRPEPWLLPWPGVAGKEGTAHKPQPVIICWHMHCNAPVDTCITTLHLHTCSTLVVASAVCVTSSGTMVSGIPDSNTMRAASGSVCKQRTQEGCIAVCAQARCARASQQAAGATGWHHALPAWILNSITAQRAEGRQGTLSSTDATDATLKYCSSCHQVLHAPQAEPAATAGRYRRHGGAPAPVLPTPRQPPMITICGGREQGHSNQCRSSSQPAQPAAPQTWYCTTICCLGHTQLQPHSPLSCP